MPQEDKLTSNLEKSKPYTCMALGALYEKKQGFAIWNHLPGHIKSSENMNIYKNPIFSIELVLLVDASAVIFAIHHFYQ